MPVINKRLKQLKYLSAQRKRKRQEEIENNHDINSSPLIPSPALTSIPPPHLPSYPTIMKRKKSNIHGSSSDSVLFPLLPNSSPLESSSEVQLEASEMMHNMHISEGRKSTRNDLLKEDSFLFDLDYRLERANQAQFTFNTLSAFISSQNFLAREAKMKKELEMMEEFQCFKINGDYQYSQGLFELAMNSPLFKGKTIPHNF